MINLKEVFLAFSHLLKFNLFLFRHYAPLFVRLVLFLLACSLLFYVVATKYYSFYCHSRFQEGLVEANRRYLWNVSRGVQDGFLPILMPVCDRPEYLKRVLQGLSKVDGIEETMLIVSQDCAQIPIAALLNTFSRPIRMLILSHKPPYFSLPRLVYTNEYAISANIKFLLEFAFEHMLANGAIVLESDLVPSVDFYRFYQWTYRHILTRNHSKVLSIHSFNLRSTNQSDPYLLSASGFDSWGWSTARTRWPWLKTEWTKFKNWDMTISKRGERDQWKCLRSHLSRTRMIGFQGINVNVETKAVEKQFNDVYLSEKRIDYDRIQPKIQE